MLSPSHLLSCLAVCFDQSLSHAPRNKDMSSSAAEPPTATSSSSRGRRHVGPTFTVDLAAAAGRLLAFFRSLRPPDDVRRSVRRYEEMWLPLVSGGCSGEPEMLLPPPDVHLVWLCHCFHHARYAAYCASRFGHLVDRPAILDAENEEYAADRCRDVWAARYPSEPFDLDDDDNDNANANGDEHELVTMVQRHAGLRSHFAAPFVSEGVYLVATRRRYVRFLHLAKKTAASQERGARLVPSLDILLMWLAHQSFPARYAADMAAVVGHDVGRAAAGFGEVVGEEEVERTRMAWEEAYDEPYETAGTAIDAASLAAAREAFYWEAAAAEDANRRYKGLQPRLLMEVYVFLKGEFDSENNKNDKEFLRLRAQRCHRSLKLNRAITSNASSKTWQKAWHLYCEYGTRGVAVEVRRSTTGCFRDSKRLKNVGFSWNELLHETTLALTKELYAQARTMASVTPPVQAPYLLKCVSDRVTDDGGAMISDVILRMRGYRPQEGRWLTRTVLDHCGKECFVVRMRIGRGIWRRGAETPTAVKWEDRIIEVREGSWSYIAGASSVGYAPEKVLGTATPRKEDQQEKVVWVLSTGDVLTVRWDDGLSFLLQNESSDEAASLVRGRRLSYQVKKNSSSDNRHEDDEEHYLTLVRTTPDNPGGEATALLNWKLLAVEFLPEEDAVFVLVLCMAIARTMTEIRREDVAGLLVRRRIREAPIGQRDWGSVMLPYSPSLDSHLQPWYRNAPEVLTSPEMAKGVVVAKYSPADGKDALYRQALIP